MDYTANQKEQIEKQLKAIGVSSVEALFKAIPKEILLSPPSEGEGLSEMEAFQKVKDLSNENECLKFKNYLGFGAYEHYIPAIVPFIIRKSEFLTSYTPYQAEASQGYLQAIFEYQSAIATLTGMEVANASVYDGASALAEAVLMALRLHPHKNKIVFSDEINPFYREVVNQYLHAHAVETVNIKINTKGQTDLNEIRKSIDDQVAAIVVQSPNALGIIEDIKEIASLKGGALLIHCANPLSFGLYETAGVLGVDIVVGDSQPFGIPLQFGGPYAGYMATRMAFVRQLPGRIIGETVDAVGKRGYVLTLQTREQHIRREKATSNICTNQALMALATLVALLWYGKEGVRKLAQTNFNRAMYLKTELEKIGFKTYSGPIFNEFWVDIKDTKSFENQHIVPGHPYKGGIVVAVTETKTKEDLDRFLDVARKLK